MPVFPVSRPTISGQNLTVDFYQKQPKYIARRIQDQRMNDFWMSDLLFQDGGMSESGSVIFRQITAIDDQFMASTTDIEDVAPGGEFPVLGYTNVAPTSAVTQKRGGKFQVTREARTRNDLGFFRNGLDAIYNNAKRKADTKALAVMNAAPFLSFSESAAWGTFATTKIRNDIFNAIALVENSQLGVTEGYKIDTMVVGSTQWLNLMLNTDLLTAYNLGNVVNNTMQLNVHGRLDGLLGIKYVRMNPFITGTERWLFDSRRTGTKVTEYPLALEQWYEQKNQSYWWQISESDTYFVTDPKSLVKIV